MSTIFPLSASVNQEFDGYRFNGTSWDIIGQEYNPTVYSGTEPSGAKAGDIWIDSSTDVPSISPETILTINAASALYLTQNSASTTYLSQSNASTTYQTRIENIDDTEIGYLNNASANIQTQLNSKANLSGATFAGNITAPEFRATTKLVAQTVGGDEGGEILLGKAATNTTLSGDGVTIDVWQNRLRIFEQGGDARGGYIDVSRLGNGVATNLTPGLVQIIPSSVTVGSGTGTVSTGGAITISGASNLVINGVFSSQFENYKMVMSQVSVTTGTAGIYMRMSKSGISSDTLYYGHSVYGLYSGATIYSGNRSNNADWQTITVATAVDTSGGFVEFQSPFVSSSRTSIQHIGSNYDASWTVHGLHNVKDNYDGIRLIPSASTMNATIRFYGYNNG